MKVDKMAFLTKTGLILLAFKIIPFPWNTPGCLFLIWVYQYIIAFIYGVHAMPAMDTLCFIGDEDI